MKIKRIGENTYRKLKWYEMHEGLETPILLFTTMAALLVAVIFI